MQVMTAEKMRELGGQTDFFPQMQPDEIFQRFIIFFQISNFCLIFIYFGMVLVLKKGVKFPYFPSVSFKILIFVKVLPQFYILKHVG